MKNTNSFDLKEKEISNQRFVYEYPASKQRGKIVARKLYAKTGNGYVLGKYMSEETVLHNRYNVDPKG